MPNFSIERTYDGLVAGVDEAGRGPWAGPVVAAAVILHHPLIPVLRNSLDDSKRLTRKNRAVLMRLLKRSADIGVGAASVSEIEQYNILVATHRAMLRAIQALHNTRNLQDNKPQNISYKNFCNPLHRANPTATPQLRHHNNSDKETVIL